MKLPDEKMASNPATFVIAPRVPPAESREAGSGAGPARPAVLIIAAAFPPESLSGAARPGRFAKYLPQFGYDPVVICRSAPDLCSTGGPGDIRRVPPPSPGLRARVLAGAGKVIQRYLLPYDDSIPWAAHALAEAEAILARRRVAAVLSTSPPVATHLVGLQIKRRHGLPWLADFRDPLAGNPFRSRRWLFPYDDIVERLIFRGADALLANTDTAAELWRLRHRGIDAKVSVIWNGFDPEDRIEAVPPPSGERRVLVHVGSLYGGRHPGRLLASLDRLLRRGEISAERVRIRLVGPFDETGLAQTERGPAAALRSLGCLEYDGKQVPRAEAMRAAEGSDYLLLLDLNERGSDLQVPAKLFEYLRVGRPILVYTQRDSPTDRILRESGIRHIAVYSDMSEAEADHRVRSLFQLTPGLERPSARFEERFDGRSQTRALAEILDSLCHLHPAQATSNRSTDR